MKTYVWVSFAFMGWAYYEMSGGSDFVPETRPETAIAVAAIETPEPVVEVTRANTASLLSVTPEPQDDQIVLAALDVDTPVSEDSVADAIAEAVEIQQFESLAIGAEAAMASDLRAVAGARVNMRQGPGTNFGVIVTLPQGTEVEVLEVDADGWARLVVPATGQEGWMAERLLTDPA